VVILVSILTVMLVLYADIEHKKNLLLGLFKPLSYLVTCNLVRWFGIQFRIEPFPY